MDRRRIVPTLLASSTLLLSMPASPSVISSAGEPRACGRPGVGHLSGDRAYAEPELYQWLLAHALEATPR